MFIETTSLFTLATELEFKYKSLEIIKDSPSPKFKSLSFKYSFISLVFVKIPVMVAFVSLYLIKSTLALFPNKRPIASIIRLFPAPVSPDKTVILSLNSISIFSIIAKFLTINLCNI